MLTPSLSLYAALELVRMVIGHYFENLMKTLTKCSSSTTNLKIPCKDLNIFKKITLVIIKHHAEFQFKLIGQPFLRQKLAGKIKWRLLGKQQKRV